MWYTKSIACSRKQCFMGKNMESIFVNFTNHPSNRWDEKQKKEALKYGKIVDMEFPKVAASGSRDYIVDLAERYVEGILELHPAAVLCQGEFCLAYHVISKLKEKGILVLAACSERMVVEDGNKKEVLFVFEQFREY